MVGDIVYSHGFNCIVYGIYPYLGYYSYELKSIDGKELGKICQEDIKEKPLTSEILEMNGWKKDDRGYSIKDLIFLNKNGLRGWSVGIGDEFIVTISYVHQLQHLLFGLGLNSEMEVWV